MEDIQVGQGSSMAGCSEDTGQAEVDLVEDIDQAVVEGNHLVEEDIGLVARHIDRVVVADIDRAGVFDSLEFVGIVPFDSLVVEEDIDPVEFEEDIRLVAGGNQADQGSSKADYWEDIDQAVEAGLGEGSHLAEEDIDPVEFEEDIHLVGEGGLVEAGIDQVGQGS